MGEFFGRQNNDRFAYVLGVSEDIDDAVFFSNQLRTVPAIQNFGIDILTAGNTGASFVTIGGLLTEAEAYHVRNELVRESIFLPREIARVIISGQVVGGARLFNQFK